MNFGLITGDDRAIYSPTPKWVGRAGDVAKGLFMPGSADQPRNLPPKLKSLNAVPSILTTVEDSVRRKSSPAADAEPLLRVFTETMPQLVWSTDANGMVDYVNRQWYEYSGITPGPFSEKDCLNSLHPQDRKQALDAWHESLRTHGPYEVEYRIRRHDGEYRWHLVRAFPVLSPEGKVIRWVGTCTDINQNKKVEVTLRQLESQLRHQEERFVLAETASRTGIWDWDLVKDNVYYSPRYKSILGFTDEELPNLVNSFTPLLHPEDREMAWAAITSALKGDSPNYEAQFRLRHKDGQYRWILARGFVFRNDKGVAVRMSGVHLDITSYKQTALSLEATERELRRVMSSISDYLWSAEVSPLGEFKYIFFSPAVMRITGRDENYYYAGPHRWIETIHPDDRPRLLDEWQKLKTGQVEALEREYRIIWPDGSIRWVRDSARVTVNGATIRIDGVVSEITDRKVASERLTQWEKIFDHAGWGVAITSAKDNSIRAGNPAFAIMHGLEVEELAQTTLVSLVAPECREAMLDFLAQADALGHITYETAHLRNDGSSFPLLADVTSVKDARGNILYRATNFQDITYLKRTETELKRKAEELARSNAELEQFAYVASHDLKEPLRMVSSYMRLLERQYKGKLSDEADQFIDFAVQGATRMYALIGDLLEFSRVGTHSRSLQNVDMNEVLELVLDNLSLAIKETKATIERVPLPTIPGEYSLLVQLLQNMIANSLKFRLGAPIIRIDAKLIDDSWVFSVQDNGIGIHPKYAEKIFVIFQRLHPRDRYTGTGIGLAICKKIVERHHGKIWMESMPGKGTTFFFSLPSENPDQ